MTTRSSVNLIDDQQHSETHERRCLGSRVECCWRLRKVSGKNYFSRRKEKLRIQYSIPFTYPHIRRRIKHQMKNGPLEVLKLYSIYAQRDLPTKPETMYFTNKIIFLWFY